MCLLIAPIQGASLSLIHTLTCSCNEMRDVASFGQAGPIPSKMATQPGWQGINK